MANARITNILSSVRYTLGDLAGDRWSDTRLLQLLSEGQQDIVRHGNMLKTYGQITLADFTDLSIYNMPDDSVQLTRATCDNIPLEVVSHDWMDEHYEGWEDTTIDIDNGGSPTHLVFDNLNQHKVRIYPKPVAIGTQYEFQIYTWIDPAGSTNPAHVITTSDANYGILVDIEDDSGLSAFEFQYYKADGTLVKGSETVPVYGIVTDIEDEDYTLVILDTDGNPYSYGLLTDIADATVFPCIKVWYSYRASNVTTTDDELLINENWDMALKHYVCGRALRDDIDAQNRAVGNEELQFYDRELQKAKKDSSKNFATAQHHSTTYRGAF